MAGPLQELAGELEVEAPGELSGDAGPAILDREPVLAPEERKNAIRELRRRME
jgi:hypothetical protein